LLELRNHLAGAVEEHSRYAGTGPQAKINQTTESKKPEHAWSCLSGSPLVVDALQAGARSSTAAGIRGPQESSYFPAISFSNPICGVFPELEMIARCRLLSQFTAMAIRPSRKSEA
jgi:hypothetical protein